MAVKSFQSYGCVEELFVDSASVPYVLKLLLEFQGIRKMPLLHAWNFIRNQGCNLVGFLERNIQDSADVLHYSLRLKCSEGGDLAY